MSHRHSFFVSIDGEIRRMCTVDYIIDHAELPEDEIIVGKLKGKKVPDNNDLITFVTKDGTRVYADINDLTDHWEMNRYRSIHSHSGAISKDEVVKFAIHVWYEHLEYSS